MTTLRLGFFTRVLDQAAPPERYRLGLEQIVHADRLGFDTAWVAQHHFHEDEGGLPAPLVFLAHAAARTSRIRLGTGIITLPLEMPLRVAEDAVGAGHPLRRAARGRRRTRRQPVRLQRLRPAAERPAQADRATIWR